MSWQTTKLEVLFNLACRAGGRLIWFVHRSTLVSRTAKRAISKLPSAMRFACGLMRRDGESERFAILKRIHTPNNWDSGQGRRTRKETEKETWKETWKEPVRRHTECNLAEDIGHFQTPFPLRIHHSPWIHRPGRHFSECSLFAITDRLRPDQSTVPTRKWTTCESPTESLMKITSLTS